MTNHVRSGSSSAKATGSSLVRARVNLPTSPRMRVGGREYEQTVVQNCHVCLSPWRNRIEEMLMYGVGFAAIARAVNAEVESTNEDGSPNPRYLSVDSITRHAKRKHSIWPVLYAQSLIEQRAEATGRVIEEGIDSLIDQHIVSQAMLQRYFEALMRGTTEPTGADAVAIIKRMDALEQAAGMSLSDEMYNSVINVLLDEIVASVGQDKAYEIVYKANQSPIIKAAMAKRAEIQASIAE